MSKITIAVCKVFKNSGSFRFHREKTKKHWKHYFIDTEDGCFHTEWISSFKAIFLKKKILKKRWFICPECRYIFQGFSKKLTDKCDCPVCEA
jgi:rubrerythrin